MVAGRSGVLPLEPSSLKCWSFFQLLIVCVRWLQLFRMGSFASAIVCVCVFCLAFVGIVVKEGENCFTSSRAERSMKV